MCILTIPTGQKIEYCTLSRDKIEYLKNPKNTGSSTHKIEYSEIKNNHKIEYSIFWPVGIDNYGIGGNPSKSQ
jgi:hypothetical protein